MIVVPRPTIFRAIKRFVIERDRPWKKRTTVLVRDLQPIVSLPFVIWFLLYSKAFHPSYGMTWPKRFRLGYRMYRNTTKMPAGLSYRAHLVMVAKLFETPPSVEGVVVECGSYLGGTTVNLSIACEITGRKLIVYDSFEGLPEADPNDRFAHPMGASVLDAPLDQVKANVAKYGVIDVCEFRKGWFEDTLPHHTEPVVLAFLDVDYQSSTHDCLVNLWPHLTEKGHLFTDDYVYVEMCSVYWSEEFWRDNLDTTPPGLIGAGSGVPVGNFWVGPFKGLGGNPTNPLQSPGSTAYTRKDFTGHWNYQRDSS